ncbi:MAG: aldehyde oxidase [Thermomicrobiales bacterium]|nr:aldehyde oxidase [Thermomicrobiales bacterium]
MPDRDAARVDMTPQNMSEIPVEPVAPVEPDTGFDVVNHSVPRRDGVSKVTGQAMFASDMSLPDMAYAKILRSPVAHARIVSIDTETARNRPGVVAVMTGDDLSGLASAFYGHAVEDKPILAIGKVRYVGEPVVAVIAEDERTAQLALDDIVVEYEELETVMTPEAALRDGAPLLHEGALKGGAHRGFEEDSSAGKGSNVCEEAHIGWGDVDAAFAVAAFIAEGDYHYPMAYAYAMEPYVAVADVTPRGLTVYASAQHPYMVRHDLAHVFGLPLSSVRVIVPYVGGGYGSKSYTKIEPLTAACSWWARRPVKLQLSVEETILTTRGDDAQVHIRTATDAAGKITARQATIFLNTGAYAENSPQVCKKAANRIVGPYPIPNVKVDAYAVYTNTCPASSFRGFGASLVTFAAESQIDELAEQFGEDALAFRQRNVAPEGTRFMPKLRGIDADMRGNLEKLGRALDWDAPAQPGRGKGLAVSASDAGAHPVTTAAIRLHGDGSVTILTGSTELGQGSQTVLAQIAAEEFGIPLEAVNVVASDTGVTPFERSTGASRTTTLMGRAVMEACRDAIAQVRSMVAGELGVAPDEIEVQRGGVRHGDRAIPWSEALTMYFGMPDCEILGRAYLRKAGDLAELPPFWEIGCAGVEIDVDEETGVIGLTRIATVGDVGLAINPATTEGQDLGAATMGLGAGLFEELIYDGEQLANGSLLGYRVPRFSDIPADVRLLLTQDRNGVGPYGAKGGGEGSLNPMAASVANALYRATGARVREAPLTPERVWDALQAHRNGTTTAEDQ